MPFLPQTQSFKYDGSFAEYRTFVDTYSNALMARKVFYVLTEKRPKRARSTDSSATVRDRTKEIKTYNDDCGVALSTVMSLLSDGVRSRVDVIYSDPTLSTRVKVNRIVRRIEEEYLPQTHITVNLFKKMMDNVEPLSPHVSESIAANQIESILTEITTISSRLQLSSPIEKYSDDSLIAKFFDKVGAHAILKPFRTAHAMIQSFGTTTSFAQLSKSVRNELISMGHVNLGRNVSRSTASTAEVVSPVIIPDMSSASSSLVAMIKGSQLQTQPSSATIVRPCWNCQGLHRATECVALICRNCVSFFPLHCGCFVSSLYNLLTAP